VPTLAVLATVPGREAAVAVCLASLRPQVDEIRVVCNGFRSYDDVPRAVKDFADEFVLMPDDPHGSAAKLRWASHWAGLYLGCDDDLEYPADYAAYMLGRVQRWKGRALVTCHGRILAGRATKFTDAVQAWAPQQANDGAWLNYPGGCALAFDTRLGVPDVVPGKNLEEAHLAVWAQRKGVPIYLAPHAAGYLRYLLAGTDLPTIWAEEKGAKFANRNAVLREIGETTGWNVHRA
jgi:hypothetical protein